MAAYVAQTKEKLRDSTSNKNPNYPEGVKDTEVIKLSIYLPRRYILAESFYYVNFGSSIIASKVSQIISAMKT